MAELDPSGYTFNTQPTKKETEIFEYVAFDYFDKNPGYVMNNFSSYIGLYYNDAGERTGPL